jgi:hypothetical protein
MSAGPGGAEATDDDRCIGRGQDPALDELAMRLDGPTSSAEPAATAGGLV